LKKFLEKIWFAITYREKGATAVEYALIVALIAVAIIATVGALGGGINAAFVKIKDAIGGV
jgi:pilus assembly protein Flp/PilA